jgi:transposase
VDRHGDGRIARARIAPAHREPVCRFLARVRGQELEVALEATTGWRFVVEELRAVGARIHLAGTKKRPKTDRADARRLRELLMLGKLRSAESRLIIYSTFVPGCGGGTR